MAGEGTPQGIATGRSQAAEHREETDLDGAMVAVMVGEAEGAEGAVGAVEAVHVALALVRVGVDRALNEEPRRQKRPQPRRPATVLLRHSTALFQYQSVIHTTSNHHIRKSDKNESHTSSNPTSISSIRKKLNLEERKDL